MRSYLLNTNKGSPWRSFSNIYFQADISSDASGTSFAGKVDFTQGTTMITSSEFARNIADAHQKAPNQLKGTTVVCSIDNQALQAIYNRKGTSKNLA